MLTISIFGFILMTVLFSILFFKYRKLTKNIRNIVENLQKTWRRGYITQSLVITNNNPEIKDIDFEPILYLREIDRYTNGTSKVEIEKIEYGIDSEKFNIQRLDKYIRERFKSIVKTTDVIWLESENEIKELRKNKLEQLKNYFNNEN
jgi:hypothetical protein